jgi:Rps23 Pro-64 3,4-dihydroxylase Tpa1-like proline 4-hydroxylase
VSTVPLELNPLLNVAALRKDYAPKKRLQVRNFLTEESAEAAHRYLEELPWGLVYNDGPNVHQLHAHMLAQLQEREAAQIMAGIRERARDQYQFLYSFYPVLTAYFSPQVTRHRIFEFFELINSEPVIDAVRAITGLPDIRWADGQATWYQPGHFLKGHTDEEAATGRVAAYVMNLSPLWERDWGGFLQFFDENDNIEEAFKPSFNTLNIFTIPQLHSVSMVSTYVTAKRLAVTGWFRSDDPPGPIGKRD